MADSSSDCSQMPRCFPRWVRVFEDRSIAKVGVAWNDPTGENFGSRVRLFSWHQLLRTRCHHATVKLREKIPLSWRCISPQTCILLPISAVHPPDIRHRIEISSHFASPFSKKSQPDLNNHIPVCIFRSP